MRLGDYVMIRCKPIIEQIRKSRLISKFMTSQTGKQIIKVYILPNIPRIPRN